MKYRGFFETFVDCEADSEEEAKKLIAQKIASRLQNDEDPWISVWDVTEAPDLNKVRGILK